MACNMTKNHVKMLTLLKVWQCFELVFNSCSAEFFAIIFHLLIPLSPHDALMHHFTSLKTDVIFLQPKVLEWKFLWKWLTNTWWFSSIAHPLQITSSTTSRELRQQFTACSGWRWQCKVRIERVKAGMTKVKWLAEHLSKWFYAFQCCATAS